MTSLHCYECAYDGCGDPFKEKNVRKKECRTTCFKSKTGTGKKIILLGDAIYIRCLTHCIFVDSSTVTCRTSPCVILEVSSLLCRFYSIFD